MNNNLSKMTAADDKIQKCIDNRKSFLLDAGAGSGKTYSLVTALNYIRDTLQSELTCNSQKVACITFTNVAKDEIIERTEHNRLFVVHTIHDFLWSVIKPFQKDLKKALLTHNEQLPASSKRKKESTELSTAMETCTRINYSDVGANYLEGRISHNDVFDIALIMFKSHLLLSHIVSARHPFILVDEYQDTEKEVICILLNHVLKSNIPTTVGFFGDKWQSIYQNRIGEIPKKLQKNLELIQKEENYRCPIAVINLLNRIRTDITQTPARENLQGSAVYINLNSIKKTHDIVDQAKKIVEKTFNWSNYMSDTKILFLTHRLIVRRAEYEELWTTYAKRGRTYQDRFQSGENEAARFFCGKIEPLIDAWRNRRVGRALSILSATDGTLASAKKKLHVSNTLDKLVQLSDAKVTIRDILMHVRDAKFVPLPEDLKFWTEHFAQEDPQIDPEMEKDRDFFANLLKVPYQQVRFYRNALEKRLPYSTKHGVKGDEFDTVFVILDDAGARWHDYSFKGFLTGNDAIQDRFVRTGNLFYVCCSRSKNKLAVIDLNDVKGMEKNIKNIFGTSACVF